MSRNTISVIIPAYKPDEKLLATIAELVKEGFDDILVVDDGSGEQYQGIFRKVREMAGCTLLCHEQNRGKGAALKTAMTFFSQYRPDRACVVTVDADGQHLAKDVRAVCEAAVAKDRIVLGTRDFSDPRIPFRSVAGNRITSVVFRLFLGMKLKDTQTGLRVFPARYVKEMVRIEGDRYEYETNVLLYMSRESIPFEQVDISTVYIDENRSSHFRVVRDSVRIYALMLKYLFSSAGASIIDALLFYLLKRFPLLAFLAVPLTFSASFAARVVSSLFNYWMNARHVFKGGVNAGTLVKYYLLAAVQICVSALLVFAAENTLGIISPALVTVTKIVVDTVLFFVSFRIQHRWVFHKKKDGKETLV